jgi:hypothetical protein
MSLFTILNVPALRNQFILYLLSMIEIVRHCRMDLGSFQVGIWVCPEGMEEWSIIKESGGNPTLQRLQRIFLKRGLERCRTASTSQTALRTNITA